MFSRSSFSLVLAFSVVPSVRAQEPAPPRPEPSAGRVERVPPPGPPDGTVRMLTSRRARLGISVNWRAPETDSIGALIQSVAPNGPAARAGLRSGDIITRFNGISLVAASGPSGRERAGPGMALTEAAAALNPGDTVAVEYRRGRERRNASIVAGDEPYVTAWTMPPGSFSYSFSDSDPMAEAMGTQRWRVEADSLRMHLEMPKIRRSRLPPPMMFVMGTPLEDLELAPLNRDLGRYFGTSEGILVINVPEHSGLALKAGDVVLAVDGRSPDNPAHLLRILQSYDQDEPIRLEIMRMKKRMAVTGKLAESAEGDR